MCLGREDCYCHEAWDFTVDEARRVLTARGVDISEMSETEMVRELMFCFEEAR